MSPSDNVTHLNFGYIDEKSDTRDRKRAREFAKQWMNGWFRELGDQGLFSLAPNQPLALLYKVVRGSMDFCSVVNEPRAYFDYGVLIGRGHDGRPAAVAHAANALRKLPVVLGGGLFRSSLEVAGQHYVHPHLSTVEPAPLDGVFPDAPWGVLPQGGAVLVGSGDLHVAGAFAGFDEELDDQLARAFADSLFLQLSVSEESA